MSATSPLNDIKICVLLTPRFMKVVMSTGKCKRMHGSFNLMGVAQMLKFMCALGLWYNEHSKRLQRSNFRAGQFIKISELRRAA